MSIPRVSNFGGNNYIKPKDDIDPQLKQNNPEYSLQMSQFIYAQYNMGSSAISGSTLDRITINRTYAEGRQSTLKYKDWILGARKDTPQSGLSIDAETNDILMDLIQEDVAMDQLNFDEIFSPLPKYVENIVGIMQSQEHDITVEATDENSGSLREDMKYDSWIKNELKETLVKFNILMNIPDLNKEEIRPNSVDELELFENIGMFKLPYEIGMEKFLAHTEDISNYKAIKDEAIADFVIAGMASTATFQDPNTGKFVHKHVELEDLVLENSKKRDFSDVSWGGFVEYYTIHELRIQTGLEEQKLLDIANNVKGHFGNPEHYETVMVNGAYYEYDDFKVPVIHSFWKTIDSEYHTTKTKENGKIKTYHEPYKDGKPKVFDSETKKTKKTDIRRIYHARWIMDSDHVFDYGILPNSPYNYGTKDTEFPIRLYRVKGKPKIEAMIPIADQIYLTFIKMQNNIAKAAPPGLAIEMSSIEDVKWGNKKLKPKDTILIKTLSGNFLYRNRAKGMPGAKYIKGGQSYKPFEELKGGLGPAIDDGIKAISFFFSQLDIITGIDGITSSNLQPSRDTGKAVTEMAIAATSNVLKPIYTGYLTLKEQNARCAAWNIQAFLDAYDNVEDCPYYKALGATNLIPIKAASKDIPPSYGFVIEGRATDQEKATIHEAAKAGLAGGKNGIPSLKFSEYSFILRYLNTGRSIKWIEIYMAKKEQEAQAQQAAQAAQAIKDQGEQTKILEETKRESMLLEKKAETESKIELERVKGEEARLTNKQEHKNAMELTRMQMRLSLLQGSKNQEN